MPESSARLESFGKLIIDVGDLEEYAELAADDPKLAAELSDQVASVQRRLAELEEERLFSGAYDAGDAVVTINAGAGGTEAQDWAEMLPRMYLCWFDRRGFKVEMTEASAGEQAGIKASTFILRGENASGSSPSSAASTGWSGSRRSTHPRAATRASPRSTWRRCRRSTSTSRSTTLDIRVDTYRAPAPAGSTSTRPTRPYGSPTSRPGSSFSARTSAHRPRTRRSRCSSAPDCSSCEERSAPRSWPRSAASQTSPMGLAVPQLLPASRPAGQGPPHGLRGRRHPAGPRRRHRRLHPRVPEQGRRGGTSAWSCRVRPVGFSESFDTVEAAEASSGPRRASRALRPRLVFASGPISDVEVADLGGPRAPRAES